MNFDRSKIFQVISLLLSSIIGVGLNIIIGFLIPSMLDFDDFSKYRILMFYIGFIPILHVGYIDGILMKYSSISTEELDKYSFKKSLYIFSIIQLFITLIMSMIVYSTLGKSVYLYICFLIPFVNISGYITKVMVLKNKFKLISLFNLFLKIALVLTALIMMLLHIKNYYYLVYAVYITYILQIIIGYFSVIKNNEKSEEITFSSELKLIKTGFPIVSAYFISTFLLGLDRIFIERSGNLEEYAYYSFAYSLITIFITIFDSLTVLIFPMIMKMEKNKQIEFFETSKVILNILFSITIIFVILIFPMINIFIPKYNNSIIYFIILFPIIFIRLNYSIRIIPQINALAETKFALLYNIFCVFILSFLNFTIYILKLNFIFYGFATVIVLSALNYFLEKRIVTNFNMNTFRSESHQLMIIILFLIVYLNLNTYTYLFGVFLNIVMLYFFYKNNIIKITKKIKIKG
ncbi:oligosaccharide flippase family protein [Exiguobacterium sp. s91]|uniref:oligosaccharide flippase family protein n=1 Tax=Exiguobacterium sp. s91 TaxID=2751199 RepID=UPI001BEB62C9|nr:oligosaccharide flippase family protein [Exiguobacterium sp. s91]